MWGEGGVTWKGVTERDILTPFATDKGEEEEDEGVLSINQGWEVANFEFPHGVTHMDREQNRCDRWLARQAHQHSEDVRTMDRWEEQGMEEGVDFMDADVIEFLSHDDNDAPWWEGWA